MNERLQLLVDVASSLSDEQIDWLIGKARTKRAWRDEPASSKQIECIQRLIEEGQILPVGLDGLTKGTASDILGELFGKRKKNLNNE